MVMPACPAAGLVFAQPHIALFSLEFSLNAPPGTTHVGQGLQGSVFRSVGQVVAGFAAVQVPAVDSPCLLARLALPGYPHSLGAEHIAPRPLASLGHCYLPPSLIRQLVTALLHGTTLPVHQPGFAGAPEPWIVRTGPRRRQGPDRSAARNV